MCRYRTQLCNDGSKCRRHICFFAHSLEELRVPSVKPFVPPDALAAATTAAAADLARKTATANAVGYLVFLHVLCMHAVYLIVPLPCGVNNAMLFTQACWATYALHYTARLPSHCNELPLLHWRTVPSLQHVQLLRLVCLHHRLVLPMHWMLSLYALLLRLC